MVDTFGNNTITVPGQMPDATESSLAYAHRYPVTIGTAQGKLKDSFVIVDCTRKLPVLHSGVPTTSMIYLRSQYNSSTRMYLLAAVLCIMINPSVYASLQHEHLESRWKSVADITNDWNSLLVFK
ncbi:hypothetical protein EDD22DRAFT_851139 [Suillus occidentalis]|nr:hypothetical protein EDD22DRAFT_851139 [Suillus occidentalis]